MMRFKLSFLVACLIALSFLLSGCELYESLYGGEEAEEGPIYIPIEDILVVEEAKGTATLDSLGGEVTINIEGLAKEENFNYEAWLIDEDANVQLSIGKFESDMDGTAELIVDVPENDILNTDIVFITKEPIPDDNAAPSDIIILEESIPESADVIDIKLNAPEKEEAEEIVEVIVGEEEVEEAEIEIIEEEVPEEIPEEAEEEAEEEEAEIEIIEEVTEEVPEEAEEEPAPGEKAIVIIVKETEPVGLKPKAHDPDADELTYAFTSPLDENGKWQTDYGDEGEYTITVTVSDGTLSTSKDVLIIVNKKEEAPVIESSSPESVTLTAKEDSKVEFSATASDLNKDKLAYSWKVDGNDASAEQIYTYKTSYDDAGAHTIKLIVSDGTLTAEKTWSITVENVNRDPILNNIDDIRVKETETATIKPEAEDPDGDALTYTISDPVGDDGVWETTYDDSGEYKVTVSVSDGVDTDSQIVGIIVEDVNRAPVIEDIVLG